MFILRYDSCINNTMSNYDKQLEALLLEVKKASSPSSKIGKIVDFLQTKVISNNHEDCLIVQKFFMYSQGEGKNSDMAVSPKEIAQIIIKSIKTVRSLSIMMVIYTAWEKCKRTSNAYIDWRFQYQKKRSEKMLQNFNDWTANQCIIDPFLCNQVISRVLAGLPTFLQMQKIRSTYLQFDSCLQWLSIFTIKNRDDHLCATRAARLVKEVTDIKLHDYEKKEHIILRRIIELLGHPQRKNGSLYLFFDRYTIKSEDIEYFINIKEDFFQDLDEDHLCNVFIALFQPGLNKETLEFFSKVSGLLKSNEQYYILRTLYQRIILPIVASKYKTHIKLGSQVFNFVLFYAAGFFTHCFIGEQGVQCLLDNIKDVEELQLRRSWGQIAIICCKQDEVLKKKTQKSLQSLGIMCDPNKMKNYLDKEKMVWTVTMHNGRKLKKYPQIQSYRFRGIQNYANQCYIISIVQALYTTDQLRNLVIQLNPQAREKQLKILKELRFLFELDLKVSSKKQVTINYLKHEGPEQFRQTKLQEDAQEYLVKFFQSLQNELKKTKNGLQLFNQIFRCEYLIKISCKDCHLERELKDRQYLYVTSYGSKENFQVIREEPLDENYKCQKCGSAKCMKITQLINKPRILILHINRFKHNKGESKKILGNNPIKRTIDDYSLAGFVAHKGTYIHAGHYLYYAKIDQTRWALFNDNKVTEFNVAEDEEFERQFRAENTPYILFYRLKKQSKK